MLRVAKRHTRNTCTQGKRVPCHTPHVHVRCTKFTAYLTLLSRELGTSNAELFVSCRRIVADKPDIDLACSSEILDLMRGRS